jgi:hypothetical protein
MSDLPPLAESHPQSSVVIDEATLSQPLSEEERQRLVLSPCGQVCGDLLHHDDQVRRLRSFIARVALELPAHHPLSAEAKHLL